MEKPEKQTDEWVFNLVKVNSMILHLETWKKA